MIGDWEGFVPGGDVDKMFSYLRKNVGCSITDEELQYSVNNSKEKVRYVINSYS